MIKNKFKNKFKYSIILISSIVIIVILIIAITPVNSTKTTIRIDDISDIYPKPWANYTEAELEIFKIHKNHNASAVLGIISDEKYLYENSVIVENIKNYKGYEIATHTLNHRDLSKLNYDEQYKEIYHSKKRLEEIFKKDLKILIPPHSHYNNETIKIAGNLNMTIMPNAVNSVYFGTEKNGEWRTDSILLMKAKIKIMKFFKNDVIVVVHPQALYNNKETLLNQNKINDYEELIVWLCEK